MKINYSLSSTVLFLIICINITAAYAQKIKLPDRKKLQAIQKKYALDPNSSLLSRVAKTPGDVIKQFKEAGMSPTEHELTNEERDVISKAIAVLPPLHQRILKQHLKSMSFLDNMPNTALTSPVVVKRGINLFHITFRAGVLHQSITDWVNEKERTCFSGGDSTISISIQAGLLSAFTYILLHEGTHIVDGSLHLNAVDTIKGKPQPNWFIAGFSKHIWKNYNTPAWPFPDSITIKSRFRPGGRLYITNEAARVYEGLSKTPFVSLYSTASWHEDLAELLTIYHLTRRLNQPFRIVVAKDGKGTFSYEPMKSATVQSRVALLSYFYAM